MLQKGSKRDGVGRVINVSERSCRWLSLTRQIGSINGLSVPGLETYAYSASKAALHQ